MKLKLKLSDHRIMILKHIFVSFLHGFTKSILIVLAMRIDTEYERLADRTTQTLANVDSTLKVLLKAQQGRDALWQGKSLSRMMSWAGSCD